MKGILGVGIISLLLGGGLGYAGGNAVIRPGSIVTGACIPLETAAKTGAMTPQQARQLGADLAKTNPDMVSAANRSWVSYGEDNSACQQFLQALKTK